MKKKQNDKNQKKQGEKKNQSWWCVLESFCYLEQNIYKLKLIMINHSQSTRENNLSIIFALLMMIKLYFNFFTYVFLLWFSIIHHYLFIYFNFKI